MRSELLPSVPECQNIGLFYEKKKKEVTVLIIDDVCSPRDTYPRLPGPGLRVEAELQTAGGH